MSEGHTLMLSLTTYKVVTIVAGLAFYMGYKLFIHGIFTLHRISWWSVRGAH